MRKPSPQEEIARCDQEIEFILSGGYGPHSFVHALGHADWEAEKYFIEREHTMKATVLATEFAAVHLETQKDLDAITQAALRTEPEYTMAISRLKDPTTVRLLHAAIGLCTESGEFLGMLKKHIYYGSPIDPTNAVEEIGDASWYQRIALDELAVSQAEMLLINVRKLRARFPNKFTEESALNRDLAKERSVLEGE